MSIKISNWSCIKSSLNSGIYSMFLWNSKSNTEEHLIQENIINATIFSIVKFEPILTKNQ